MSTDETIHQGETAQRGKPELAGYVLQNRLGRGSFGEVWMGTQKSTGQSVAIKFFFDADLSYIRRELERLREVSDHFTVVGLVDADLDHQPAYFVMPLLARSLAQEVEPPSIRRAAAWMGQLAAGLRPGALALRSDSSNGMLDESDWARLVDFGPSRQQGDGVVAWGTLGRLLAGFCPIGRKKSYTACPL